MTISIRKSPSAMQFDKVLRAFETGGFTYVDVRSQLKIILAKGASASELIETLRRRERVEPLPPQAHEEVLRLLNDAVEQQAEADPEPVEVSVDEGAAQSTVPLETDAGSFVPSHAQTVRELQDQLAEQSTEFETLARAYERTKDVQTAASERVTALAAELATATRSLEGEQNKNRELGKALAERSASADAYQARGEELLGKAKEYDLQLRAAREALAEREADLADARALLEREQQNVRAMQQAHAQASAVTEPLRAKTHEALRAAEHSEAESKALRAALADREAKLAALEQVQASVMQGQADLSAARGRADALLLELNSSRSAAASLDAQLKRAQFDLDASHNELSSVKAQAQSYFDLLRTREWRRASEHSAASPPAQPEARDPAAVESSPVGTAPVEPNELPGPDTPAEPKFVIAPETWIAAAAALAPRSRFGAPRVYALAAVVLVLAAVIAFLIHGAAPSAPVKAPLQANFAPGTVIRDCPGCPAMVVLPTGRFKQGANEGDNSSSFDKPRHWVAMSHPLAMSRYAVTLDQYAAFVAATGRDVQGCDVYDGTWKRDPAGSWKNPGFTQTGAHPVTCVSWNDAQAYASWVSSRAGHAYRLPSASEWEYAARAGSESTVSWGSGAADACANANVADRVAAQRFPGWSVFGCSDGWVFTAPVGSFKANAFALHDMLGNVFQWTQDCWKEDYVGAPIDGSARTDGNCAQRELRGGSWFSNPSYVRTNYRNHFATDYRTSSVGIRLVRDME